MFIFSISFGPYNSGRHSTCSAIVLTVCTTLLFSFFENKKLLYRFQLLYFNSVKYVRQLDKLNYTYWDISVYLYSSELNTTCCNPMHSLENNSKQEFN